MFKAVVFFLFINTCVLLAGNLENKFISSVASLPSELVPYVEKINGIDRKYFIGKKLLVPPDLASAKNYCPVGKIQKDYLVYDSVIMVYRLHNVFAVYDHGRLLRWGPITRARNMKYTTPGNHFVKSKARLMYSRKYGNVPMPYSLHIVGNVCIHQGPMVGYPASHGCIRLFKDDAVWLYNWARRGTPVIIV